MTPDELRATIRRRPVVYVGIGRDQARRFWVTSVRPHGVGGWFADTGQRDILHPGDLRAGPIRPEQVSDSATMRP